MNDSGRPTPACGPDDIDPDMELRIDAVRRHPGNLQKAKQSYEQAKAQQQVDTKP